MPVSHVSLPTGENTFKAMRDFYVAILRPLGYKIFMEEADKFLGMGPKYGNPDFWLHGGGNDLVEFDGNMEKRGGRTHVAFAASSRVQVDSWYKAAVKAGGIPNGKPGERTYTKGYYAAFVIDPLGNNIEVMHWSPIWLKAMTASPYAFAAVVGAGLSLALARYYR